MTTRRATRCAVTGKAAFESRAEAKQRLRAASMSNAGATVYRCAAADHWHIGHQPERVASGAVPRMSMGEQVLRLGVDDRVVRQCPACGAEGTLRVGILHAAACDWRKGDERLPLRR